MAQEENDELTAREELANEVAQLNRRLQMFDQRLDSIDSMVSAVAERIMSQAVTLNITCPSCGNGIEITVIGNKKISS